MSNRIKETLEAYAETIGSGKRENVFSPDYQPRSEHEFVRKEYYALTAQIIGHCWEHIEGWRQEHPGKLIVTAADADEITDKISHLSFFSYAHLHYALIPDSMLFDVPFPLHNIYGPYKKAETAIKYACSITTACQTRVWTDKMKYSSLMPAEKKVVWKQWEEVLKKRMALQPESVHGRRQQIEWGFAHGWGSIIQITRQVIDAFYNAYGHLPIQPEEHAKVKNDVKNYLINLSLLTTPLEIFFETLSHNANDDFVPYFAYDKEKDPAELYMNIPEPTELTRQEIYETLHAAIGKTNVEKTTDKQRLGCPVSLHVPGRHQPSTTSLVADFYLDVYKKLLQHPQATEWYEEELAQKSAELVSFG